MVSSQGGLFQVDVIVLDEVHYLSDISRGTVWEEIVRNYYFPGCFFIHDLQYALTVLNSLFFKYIYIGYLLSKRSSTYMFVGNRGKPR